MSFRHISLFSGVDAVGIAVRALGGETTATCETNPYCQQVLKLRLPDAEHFEDIRELAGEPGEEMMSGGFPCQDLSVAGLGKGLDGDRSGLWTEYARVISEVRPKLVLVENVPRLLGLHFERLLRDLFTIGYDCEWDVISAAAVGAPHLRERLWLLAYPHAEYEGPRAFGQPIKRSLLDLSEDGVKWPRAGYMRAGAVWESEPVAPRRTKRIDGKTYWAGVNLFGSGQLAMLPTPNARDWKDYGPSQGNRKSPNLGTAVHLFPTPSASSYGTNHGGAAGRVGQVRHSLESMARHDLWPAPSRAVGTGGPGRSEKRAGGLNLRTAAAEQNPGRGSLNPDWVEWMMGLPVGLTDLSCEEPIYHPYSEEPGPRVIASVPHRRERLSAIGNALVWLVPYWILSRYQANVGLPRTSHIRYEAFS